MEMDDLGAVLAYHQRTKHQPRAMAAGPAGLDWSNQPDPFRRYQGAPCFMLARQGFSTAADESYSGAPLCLESLSEFFFESLAISGRKGFAGSSWPLRVNPSSGNLHPIEAYLIAGPLAWRGGGEVATSGDGIRNDAPAISHGSPALYHYAPQSHSLETLARVTEQSWERLGLPAGTVLLAFSSIYWREAWKYGERAFRYCMLDAGHALAAAALAAGCLGWRLSLQEGIGRQELAGLLGLNLPGRPQAESGEEEQPVMLVSIFTDGLAHDTSIHSGSLSLLEIVPLPSRPNSLSPRHVSWPAIDLVARASDKPPYQETDFEVHMNSAARNAVLSRYRPLLRRRRSAQAMDGRSVMPLSAFQSILRAVLPELPPGQSLPWRPCVHPVFFVHRVEGLSTGLYILLRDEGQKECLLQAMRQDFVWQRPSRIAEDQPFYLLAQGDSRLSARAASCRQEIASDGCFAAAMIARFGEPLKRYGPRFYPRLLWECGVMGQALYLAAEAEGFQGCGIGCFFDDMVHDMLGLSGLQYQDLYHFTVGRARIDSRILDLPPYE